MHSAFSVHAVLGACALSLSVLQVAAKPTCFSPATSCMNTTAEANLCCYNAPASLFVLNQVLSYEIPSTTNDYWTIQSLATTDCNGNPVTNCNKTRDYASIVSVLQEYKQSLLLKQMAADFPSTVSGTTNNEMWTAFWAQYGTCISTLDQNCYNKYKSGEEVPEYFRRTINLFRNNPTGLWLSDAQIYQSRVATYALADIQSALTEQHGQSVLLTCSGNNLTSVGYYYGMTGAFSVGSFSSTPAVGATSNCPAQGVMYQPKPSS